MALNDRQERFAQLVVEGNSQAEAYRQAYPNASKWQDKTVWEKASLLAAIDKVSARVAELRSAAAKRHEITVDSLIAELEEARQAALAAETVQASAAISSTMGKARLLKLDTQVIESKNETVMRIELVSL